MFELCVITDRKLSNGLSEADIARRAYEGGADIVQLRMKDSDGKEMLEQALKIRAIADDYAGIFIVNDRVDIAHLSDADGVHLGQSDIPVKYARKVLGDDKIIGASAHNVQEAIEAENKGANYVGVGSIYTTSTKLDAQQGVGIGVISEVRQAVDIPVIAIGGINRGNIQEVIIAGANGVAVVSAVVSQKDITAATQELREMIMKVRPNI